MRGVKNINVVFRKKKKKSTEEKYLEEIINIF